MSNSYLSKTAFGSCHRVDVVTWPHTAIKGQDVSLFQMAKKGGGVTKKGENGEQESSSGSHNSCCVCAQHLPALGHSPLPLSRLSPPLRTLRQGRPGRLQDSSVDPRAERASVSHFGFQEGRKEEQITPPSWRGPGWQLEGGAGFARQDGGPRAKVSSPFQGPCPPL